MNSYYIEGCDTKDYYKKFIRFMMSYSESFSCVYFKYNDKERLKKTVSIIKERLEPYKLYSEKTSQLPSMETTNENGHIYELTVYRSCVQAVSILEEVGSLWKWDYPRYPMDLCFFRAGYAWFVSSAHEEYGILYTDDLGIINYLCNLGIKLKKGNAVKDDELYWEKGLKSNANRDGFHVQKE